MWEQTWQEGDATTCLGLVVALEEAYHISHKQVTKGSLGKYKPDMKLHHH